MGIILAKFRKEKSTQEILEELQEKIDTLDTCTYDTQEQKKKFVGNFLAISIGVYIIAFIVFYFVYFPPTWRERMIYFIPLLLFPIVIILLRYLFTWYFQRKLNKNSKKLSALRAEKKKILEQVMDKETYKVAVNLLVRFADKPSKSSYTALSSNLHTPSKSTAPTLNRSLPPASTLKSTTQLASTSSSSTPLGSSSNTSLGSHVLSSQSPTSPLLRSHNTPRSTTGALTTTFSGGNQVLRRRTPFPIVNQNEKGVFEKIVDVLIGDGPGDRFAMICKECYAHNGMALKEDFEYTTFRCAFCNALNPARKARPAAPRLSVMPAPAAQDSSSDEKDDSDDDVSPVAAPMEAQLSTPLNSNNVALNDTSSSSDDEHHSKAPVAKLSEERTTNGETSNEFSQLKTDKKFENLEKSDSAIDDVTMSPEEN